MKYQTRIIKKQLHFKQPAGTSRGTYTTRNVWYILLTESDGHRYGVGECAPLPALSCDDLPDYDEVLAAACCRFEQTGEIDRHALLPYPSILFGLETALLHLQAGSLQFWPTPFSQGKAGIPINGLIWMGNFDEMYRRIEEKMQNGFRCIKLKIGAIDFERELELLAHIRRHFTPRQIELRVDANGAFTPADAPAKLQCLSEFQLHSIEQPIRAGQWKEMAALCASTPFPIALDEELIGINERARKIELLETIRPQYIILKPSLHGGISGSEEWMELAAERGIGSWVTSALESNVGLNAIAQWCGTLDPVLPQGLGTGLLFTDNIDYPLYIEGDCLRFHPEEPEPELLNWLQA
ncbi:o-succinylbenzoate synthase [Bacteroides sp.]|uniref:o-succinylbenzoate synthase n=1 Tax=Bacteroides sp. TaxID=29523 RepID=UPI003AB75727